MTTTEQFTPPAPRQPKAPRSKVRQGVVAAAVALVIAGGGGAAVWATSGSDTSSAIGQAPAGMGPGGTGGGPGGANDLLSGVSHGEMQTGAVTAITATSLTATSTDGYTRTYVIDSATVFAAATAPGAGMATGSAADIAAGDTVTVVATTTGDTATAVRISETA
ncbi:hypothetical protein [Umezawaea tangerina]|uniref:DUF5666 domain-containing protein n=1 Tax=Umezawaea tangerina TaxID=84725 RepID=A0A2T0SYX5_9PSEU|nr:hypothetical protein [Umezawaea tangerina]PRY38604.1 hypothetical protein CLV43_1083 [Umezawaea tangerina]